MKKPQKRRASHLGDKPTKSDEISHSLFRREDWTFFRNLGTLGQRAGVPCEKLPRLIAKELTDNALDTGGACKYGPLDGENGFYVADDGPGLPGTDEEIADLFSIARPLASSKLLRLPIRGALGNGLRVVAGAVLASGGRLEVKTRGRSLHLTPRDSDGGTDVERVSQWNGKGTRVEVVLGDALPVDDEVFEWAEWADSLAGVRTRYRGRTSAYWYDSDAFHELLQAAGDRTVRDLAENFDGYSGRKAGGVAADYRGR